MPCSSRRNGRPASSSSDERRDDDDDGVGHDGVRDPVPAGSPGGRRLPRSTGGRSARRMRSTRPVDGQRVDPRAEDAEQRGQEGHRVEQGREHGQHPADAERAERRGAEHEQAAEPDGDREPGERDGLARGRDRDLDGAADVAALLQLLAEPADHEQRVVDREREAQHRRDVRDVDAHLDLLADDVDERRAWSGSRGRRRGAGCRRRSAR